MIIASLVSIIVLPFTFNSTLVPPTKSEFISKYFEHFETIIEIVGFSLIMIGSILIVVRNSIVEKKSSFLFKMVTRFDMFTRKLMLNYSILKRKTS